MNKQVNLLVEANTSLTQEWQKEQHDQIIFILMFFPANWKFLGC